MQDKTAMREIPLELIDAHPANPNLMSADQLNLLAANIQATGRYQPLVVRQSGDRFQTLNGAQRGEALRRLGYEHAWCISWEVSDEDALLLLASLNSIHGDDVPALRSALLSDLAEHRTLGELATLLPEDEVELSELLDEELPSVDQLLSEFEAAHAAVQLETPQLFSFAVPSENAPDVEAAIEVARSTIDGKNQRGRALVALARSFLEASQ